MKLKSSERTTADTLSDRHQNIRIYRGRGGILLSRDAMHSCGREIFWLRFPNTATARSARRRGMLVHK